MRIAFRVPLMFVFAAVIAVASDSIPELKARADQAHGGEQAKLCLEYAQRELEEADALYTKGDVEKAQAEVEEVVTYAKKAAEVATSSGKRLKQTEIGLRELAKRMRDIGNSLAFEDRAPVNKGVDEIEQARSTLLNKMFSGLSTPPAA